MRIWQVMMSFGLEPGGTPRKEKNWKASVTGSVAWKKYGSRARTGLQRSRVYGTETPRIRTGSGLLLCEDGQSIWRTREREPSQPMSIEPMAEVPSVNVAVTVEAEVVSKESMVLFHYRHQISICPAAPSPPSATDSPQSRSPPSTTLSTSLY